MEQLHVPLYRSRLREEQAIKGAKRRCLSVLFATRTGCKKASPCTLHCVGEARESCHLVHRMTEARGSSERGDSPVCGFRFCLCMEACACCTHVQSCTQRAGHIGQRLRLRLLLRCASRQQRDFLRVGSICFTFPFFSAVGCHTSARA